MLSPRSIEWAAFPSAQMQQPKSFLEYEGAGVSFAEPAPVLDLN